VIAATHKAPLFALVVALFSWACTDEALSPVPVDAPDGGSPPTPPTTDPPAEPPVEPLRTIVDRNPFGNVAASDNLLWDGDFEWASPFTDQYGWFQLPSSLTLEEVVVGPACRSGMKCARVDRSDQILGIAVGSSNEALVARAHVRFEPDDDGVTPPCSDAAVVVLDLGGLGPADDSVELTLLTPTPDVTGYCIFAGQVEPRNNKPYVYIENNGRSAMLVDDVTLLRASSPAASKLQAGGASPKALPLRASLAPRIAAARDAWKVLRTLPDTAKQNRAKELFEQDRARRVRLRTEGGAP
jgi:hypothetical protein